MFNPPMDSCCSDKIEKTCEVPQVDSEEENTQDEEKGCCENQACDCLCCGHIYIKQAKIEVTFNETIQFHSINDGYTRSYHFNDIKMVWHPPKDIQ